MPGGEQSAPHTLPRHEGTVAQSNAAALFAMHWPDALQANGSSDPGGVQSEPQTLVAHDDAGDGDGAAPPSAADPVPFTLD